ncbi:MAG: helix-turn-helix domain-containing protein [Bacillota bacterium]
MNEVFLDPEQAAKMLNLSAYTVRAYARQGLIPAHKIGRAWRFSRPDLEEWVLAKRQQPSPADGFVARDRASLAAADSLAYTANRKDVVTDNTDARQQAVETLRAIRARARKGGVLALVQESRRDLLARGSADHESK